MEWPPKYHIRTSKKATKPRLVIKPAHGLEVVVPDGARLDISKLLADHKHWIMRHLSQCPTPSLPDSIDLLGIDECWQVDYDPRKTKLKLYERPGYQLMLQGDCDHEAVSTCLKAWLVAQAKLHLTRLLMQISEETQLSYRSSTVRLQKTRWGSCSSQKNINLNAKLLLLPQPLLRHIIIHELCHTRYMSHGVRFWGLVEKFDVSFKQHRQLIKTYEQKMPWWVLL